MKRILYIALTLFGLGALAYAIVGESAPSSTDDSPSLTTLPELEPPATPVATQTVQKRDFVQQISASGVFKAWVETDLVAQVSGPVGSLHVEEGHFVSQGDTILQINAESYRLAYLQAKDQMTRSLREYAAIALSSNQMKRGQLLRNDVEATVDTTDINDRDALALFADHSPKQWIASTTGLTRNRLEVRKAELDLEHTVIKAPFDAYITQVAVSPGGMVVQGRTLMRLVALDPLRLDVPILESELRLVQLGAQVAIRPHAFPDEQFTGIIKAISPVVDAESGTCSIHIEIGNPDHLIKPGMFAQVEVETKVFQQRLLIPRDALLIRDDRALVFVHEAGQAKWRYVRTGLENDDFIEIEEGLSEGEELIVSGHFNLAHDAKVVVVQR